MVFKSRVRSTVNLFHVHKLLFVILQSGINVFFLNIITTSWNSHLYIFGLCELWLSWLFHQFIVWISLSADTDQPVDCFIFNIL